MKGLSRTIAVLALSAGLTLSSAVGAVADLEDELADVNSKIDDLESRLDDVAADRSQLVESILDTRDRMNAAQAALNDASAALRAVRSSLEATDFELAATQRRLESGYRAIAQTRRTIEEGRGDAQQWVREQYKRQAEETSVATLMTSEHVSAVGRTVYFLQAVAERSTASVDRYQALGVEEERQQARIESQERDLIAIRDSLELDEARRSELSAETELRADEVRRELATQQRQLDKLESLISEFETEIEGLDAEQKRIEELIAGSSGGGGTSPGDLVRPVPGAITSPFGPRHHPILGYTRMHTGVDMTAPLGQRIVAGAGGTVLVASTYGGYGLTVIIDHGGGMTTLYAHQSEVSVSPGDRVVAGQAVGRAGSSGLATGPHLHFEVRLGGTPVDPADYL